MMASTHAVPGLFKLKTFYGSTLRDNDVWYDKLAFPVGKSKEQSETQLSVSFFSRDWGVNFEPSFVDECLLPLDLCVCRAFLMLISIFPRSKRKRFLTKMVGFNCLVVAKNFLIYLYIPFPQKRIYIVFSSEIFFSAIIFYSGNKANL